MPKNPCSAFIFLSRQFVGRFIRCRFYWDIKQESLQISRENLHRRAAFEIHKISLSTEDSMLSEGPRVWWVQICPKDWNNCERVLSIHELLSRHLNSVDYRCHRCYLYHICVWIILVFDYFFFILYRLNRSHNSY